MDETASVEILAALTDIWSAIRRHHPDVPPVMLLAAPSPHRHGGVLGHFSPLRWRSRGKRRLP